MHNIVVIVVSAVLIGWLFWKADRPVAVILSAAYLLRLLVFYADVYHLFPNPFSGSDTEVFHAATLSFLFGDGAIRTNYTYVLAVLYRVFGDYGRHAAQFLNVLLSFGTVALLYWALRILEVSRKWLFLALSIVAFMPAMVFLSGVLLREAWIQFFLMLAVCFFVRWYKKGGFGNEIVCLIAAMAAMLMHAGCVGALAVYMLGFLVCRTWKTEGAWSYTITVSLAVSCFVPLFLFPELFLAKFVTMASSEGAVEVIPTPVAAGSTYLAWMEGLSLPVRLLLSPVRMLYLLFSPLPFDWRGLSDAAVFCVDSLVYIVLIVLMFRPPLLGRKVQLKRFLGYAVLLLTFVFAMGTSNAGTAVRHRAKILPVLVLVAAYPKKVDAEMIIIPAP